MISSSPAHAVARALEAMRHGRMIVMYNDCGEPPVGYLAIGAQFITAAGLMMMTRTAYGPICLALPEARCRELGLVSRGGDHEHPHRPAPTVSVDARRGVENGVSAKDRMATIDVILDRRSRPLDLVRPGNVFPVAARPGGVLVRTGSPEAAVDLALAAGLTPAVVLCSVLSASGGVASETELRDYCGEHDLAMVRMAELFDWKSRSVRVIDRAVETQLPTRAGDFSVIGYASPADGREHLALTHGPVTRRRRVLVGVHKGCVVGDAFGALSCDCRQHLQILINRVADESGVVIYVARPRQDLEYLARPLADQFDCVIASQILADLEVASIRLLAGDQRYKSRLELCGTRVDELVPLSPAIERLRGHAPRGDS